MALVNKLTALIAEAQAQDDLVVAQQAEIARLLALIPQPPAVDTTAPALVGAISVFNIAQTSYTLTWPAATDDVGVSAYEMSLDGGSTWTTAVGEVTGRTPGATDQVRIRARDAAGNVSAALSASVALLAASPPTQPVGAYQVITEPVADIRRVLLITSQHDTTSAYERWQTLHIHTNPGAITVGLWNLQAGGARLTCPAGSYTLRVDGVDVATINAAAGQQVTFPAVTLAPGYRRLAVIGPDGLRSPSWFVHSGSLPVDALIPACTSTYEIFHAAVPPPPPGTGPILSTHRYTWVPADATPTASPMQQRNAAPFTSALLYYEAYRRQLVPQTTQWRVYTHSSGIKTTFGHQSYFFSDLTREFPTWPLLDGPRGVGTLNMPTHVHVGKATKTADPASGPVGALYVTDPWRLMRVGADGSVRTLLGYRHTSCQYWEEARNTKPPLVGNWDAVAGPKGLWECWGFEFDPATLAVDTSLAPIDGRHPHSSNPTGYLADTRHNRVLKVVFDGRSHDTPAVITEHITGLSDPWRVTIDPVRRWLIVSERTAHRVTAYSIETGALIKTILQGADLAELDSARSARRRLGVTLAQVRAEPIVSPEGLALRGDWLYVGSLAQYQVRRVNLATDVVEVFRVKSVNPTTKQIELVDGILSNEFNGTPDGNMRFVDVAVSDGTVGPEGTIFVSTWSNARAGCPLAYLPDGTQWYLERYASTGTYSGRAPWPVIGYSSGVGVGGGRILFGSSDYGLHEYTKAATADPMPNASQLAAGAAALDPLLYGPGGISPWGLPSPRGMSAAVDHLLNINETA